MASNKTTPFTDKEIDRQYAYWRFRLTYALILGYAAFYIVRQNFAIALPAMAEDPALGQDIKIKLGWAMGIFGITYGIFKFISGMFCDRLGARFFMPIGLIGSSICSLVIAFSHKFSISLGMAPIFLIGLMYALNAPFQSAGWPPVSRSLTQWFGPKKLGTRWGIVNASHQVGSVMILMGGAYLIETYNWQAAFWIPAIVCIFAAIFVFERLRDNPESLGLPPVEEKEGIKVEKIKEEEGHETITFGQIFRNHILFNRPLWFMCVANFFVYIVRMGFFYWAPTMILETRGTSLMNAGFKTSVFEAVGLVGGIAAGWLTDKFFTKTRGLCGVYMMIGLGISIAVFRWMPETDPWVSKDMIFGVAPWMNNIFFSWIAALVAIVTDPDTLLWAAMGFLVYGPQTLTGLSSAEFGSKKAAAAAAGLNGTAGYLGAAVAGPAIPWVAKHWGWDYALVGFVIASLLGAFFFGMSLIKKKA